MEKRRHRRAEPSAAPARSSGSSPEHGRQVPDPESRAVIEPERGAEQRMSSAERENRIGTHTDRTPADDFHQAAQSPQQSTDGG